MKKILSTAVVLCLCGTFAIAIKQQKSATTEAWVGIGYAAAKKGHSAETCAAVGVAGVAHAAFHGAVWGMAFGGPVGAAASFAVSL